MCPAALRRTRASAVPAAVPVVLHLGGGRARVGVCGVGGGGGVFVVVGGGLGGVWWGLLGVGVVWGCGGG